MKLLSFDEYFKENLKDPEFKKLWAESEVEYQLSRQIIKKRLDKKISQQELAKRAKTTQAIISRLENSSFNPSIHLLKRISAGLGSKLTISI
jgi:ribosome-binding protein aMBF1 (putative translation factor)